MHHTVKKVTTSVASGFASIGLVLAEHPLVASMVVAYLVYHYLKRLQVRR